MTTVITGTVGSGNNVDSDGLKKVGNGTLSSKTTTSFIDATTNGMTFTFSGTGFTYSGNTPTGGTITSFTFKHSGETTLTTWSKFSLSAATVWTALKNGDVTQFDSLFFGGNDTFTANTTDKTDGDQDNILYGFSGNDTFNMQADNNFDQVYGGDGNDTINYGGNLTATNTIDGGSGTDTLVLNGDYLAGFTLSATITNIEKIQLTAGHNYTLTTDDANVAAGMTLTVDASALGSGNRLYFDGRAETNGKFVITGGAGDDTFKGGAGNDTFNGGAGNNYCEAGTGTIVYNGGADGDVVRFQAGHLVAADKLDGGGSANTVTLVGDYTGSHALVMNATTIVNFNLLQLLPGYSYDITTNNATVAAGQTFYVDAGGLGVGTTLTFNGSAETDGGFYIYGGGDSDSIVGGAGGDVIYGYGGKDTITGGGGADVIYGGDGDDVINGGGSDYLAGGSGNDAFNLGATLLMNTIIDGGDGTDMVNLDGDYSAGVVFWNTTMVNVERLYVMAGHNYNLTTNDANVGAGQNLKVSASALGSGNKLKFNGAGETDGTFSFTGGAGNDSLAGGAGADSFDLTLGGNDTANGGSGNDTFKLGATLDSADRINGGTGTDTVKLDGDYSAGLTFSPTTFVSVETLTLAAGHSYTLTTDDGTVGLGKTLRIDASALGSGEILNFNGAAETDGNFRIIGGLGGDQLRGGALSDTFVYTSAMQSTGVEYDTISGFNFSSDILDIPGAAGTITAIDTALKAGTLSTATFNADLATAMNGHLGAHHAILFRPDAGTLAGKTFLVIDLNGVSGYQTSQDLVIRMSAATGVLAPGGFH
ncbi:MAG TPA: calcium-binding protein [Rhizomicrobium sp.]|nr:calcium-binding protein [Rhizomicrobium sp.]